MSARETEHIAPCRGCGAPIVFLRTKTRKLIPVNADTVNRDDYDFDPSRHVSHFATCPQANEFRR